MEASASSTIKNNNRSVDDPDVFRCDLCEIPYIHKNDYENHVLSRGHKKRLRQKEREGSKEREIEIRCEICDRILRGVDCYNAHLGSKTHRRNVRKIQEAKEPPPSDLPIGIRAQANREILPICPPLDERFNSDFITKKYVKSDVRIENVKYKTYIYSLTACLSLQLAFDQTVEDFMISVNEKDWSVFGNIVIHISYKDRKVTYAIQCKRVTQSFRQISDLQEVELHLNEQYNYISQLRDKGVVISKTRFIIATTWGIDSNFNRTVTLKPSTLNEWKTEGEDVNCVGTINIKSCPKKHKVINVSGDPENVYTFVLADELACGLPQLFLYTEQKISPSSINELLELKFGNPPDISAEYIKYIGNWVEGQLGGNYRLNKKDVVLKIGELLLEPYTVPPKKIDSKHNDFTLWNEIVNKVDLIVVKDEPFIISKICQPLNVLIENSLSTTIDTITETVGLRKRDLSNIKEQIRPYFLCMDQKLLGDDIPLSVIYKVFWKAGEIPLLMSAEDCENTKEFILNVILFMKRTRVHKKFLIKCTDLNFKGLKKNLKVFTNLDDVKDLADWSQVKIRVNERLVLPLNIIQKSDPFFFRWITPNIFFDIALSKYSLKSSYLSNKHHIGKDVLRVILNDDIKDELQSQLYPQGSLTETDANIFSQERLRGIEAGII